MAEPAPRTPQRPRWLSPGVLGVAAASFFSDAGHEMATSLLPGFVTGVLGGGASALAAIEGVADALTGVTKLAGGPLAADPRRRGRLARGGYLGTAIATAAIGATTAIWTSRLYLAIRSPRAGAPVLSWPQPVATARSAMKVSGVSPERWDTIWP